jgi:hypothetical protein
MSSGFFQRMGLRVNPLDPRRILSFPEAHAELLQPDGQELDGIYPKAMRDVEASADGAWWCCKCRERHELTYSTGSSPFGSVRCPNWECRHVMCKACSRTRLMILTEGPRPDMVVSQPESGGMILEVDTEPIAHGQVCPSCGKTYRAKARSRSGPQGTSELELDFRVFCCLSRSSPDWLRFRIGTNQDWKFGSETHYWMQERHWHSGVTSISVPAIISRASRDKAGNATSNPRLEARAERNRLREAQAAAHDARQPPSQVDVRTFADLVSSEQEVTSRSQSPEIVTVKQDAQFTRPCTLKRRGAVIGRPHQRRGRVSESSGSTGTRRTTVSSDGYGSSGCSSGLA